MNVAVFASAFYPHVGGVEELVRQLAHAYEAKGHKVIILTNRWPRSLPCLDEYEGIPVYRLAFRVPEGGLKARLSYIATHRAIVSDMLTSVRKHETDMLHVQCISSNAYYACIAKQALGLPLVVTTQGERTMDSSQIYQRSRFYKKMLRVVLEQAQYITACSQNTLDDMQDWYGSAFSVGSGVIYNGISLAEFARGEAYPHTKPYILGIGRLVKQKGLDVLIDAFGRADLDNYDLLIAGEGAEREALETQASRLGLDNRVRFLGRADRPTVIALFKGCSFFVLPSRHEPQGIVNLEAMAAGKAVIASKVGGVSEIVQHGISGILVPPENSSALARAIISLAGNPSLVSRLGAAGRIRAEGFDWPVVADQYLTIYKVVRRSASPVVTN